MGQGQTLCAAQATKKRPLGRFNVRTTRQRAVPPRAGNRGKSSEGANVVAAAVVTEKKAEHAHVMVSPSCDPIGRGRMVKASLNMNQSGFLRNFFRAKALPALLNGSFKGRG